MAYRAPIERYHRLAVFLVSLVTTAMTFACLAAPLVSRTVPPPDSFQPADLVGIWDTSYPIGVFGVSDQIRLFIDGRFKQYASQRGQGDGDPDYHYESDWGKWWLEKLPDGTLYVHIQGGRYYLDGIEAAERGALPACPSDGSQPIGTECNPDPPHPYFDCARQEDVYMAGELILSVRKERDSDRLALVPMALGSLSCASLPLYW